MEINVRGKNIDVNPAVKQYAEKKLSKIDRYLRQSPLSCQATFSTERGNYVLEVTIPLNGYLLRAEETAHDAVTAVDMVIEKLEKQIEKYRTRIFKRDKGDAPNGSFREDTGGGRIAKVKKFPVKPMSPEEATMQMELLGHDFYVFRNSETGSVNVVYRRKDGDYGLIEPEE
ncbi:MAG TPA: ribosome-associated translation inhibitor RaiA [Firmicutes bacterium]|nr:ribosome-associated translation inhibitor RaiA [Candidatus Fermentithermobacillaceae bacterium]